MTKMAQPTVDLIDVATAVSDSIEWMEERLVDLKAATTEGEAAKALDDILTGSFFVGNMRDIVLREMCRNGWKPTSIESQFGVCKPTVSRALRRSSF